MRRAPITTWLVHPNTYRIPAHVRAVIDEDGAVLLDIRQGTYFSLNPLGVEIWRHLESGLTTAEIEERVLTEFDASPDVVRTDVHQFLQELSASQLIHAD